MRSLIKNTMHNFSTLMMGTVIDGFTFIYGNSLVAQIVKNLPAMQETQVRSLGQEDPLEKGMATHFQYSCLENSMDRGAYWGTVHGVAKRRTLSD